MKLYGGWIFAAFFLAFLWLWPYPAGTAYVIGGAPLFGLTCGDWRGLLKAEIPADSLRMFLMNRGCEAEPEVRRIVVRDFDREAQDPRQLDRLSDIAMGRIQPVTATEIGVRDVVHAELRRYRPVWLCGRIVKTEAYYKPQERCISNTDNPQSSVNCILRQSLGSVNECYRGTHDDGWVSRLIHRYWASSTDKFTDTVNAVIDTGGDLVRESVLARALLIAFYLALPFLLKLGYELIKDLLRQQAAGGK
jgi:hypothetical protein